MPETRSFDDILLKKLQDPCKATAYISAILEECRECEKDVAHKLLMAALKDIAEAQGGMSQLSGKTGLGRESLYKTLSKKGNPRFDTLTTVINALGIDIQFCLPHKR